MKKIIFLLLLAPVTQAQSWVKREQPLKITHEKGYAFVTGFWLLSTDDPKDQISYPTAVHISCDRAAGTCLEIYASLESGRLKVDSNEYVVAHWDDSGIEADGANTGLCDIGHRLTIDFKVNSATVTDYAKHAATNDLCKPFQQPKTFVLRGGNLDLVPMPEWKLGRAN